MVTLKAQASSANKNVSNCGTTVDQPPTGAYISQGPPILDTGYLVAVGDNSIEQLQVNIISQQVNGDGMTTQVVYQVGPGNYEHHYGELKAHFVTYPSGAELSDYPEIVEPFNVPQPGPLPTCGTTSTNQPCNQKTSQNTTPPSNKINPSGCKIGDPCDVFSLNYYHHEVDLALAGMMPLQIKRGYYSGKNTTVNEFGVGSYLENYNYTITPPKNTSGQVVTTANSQLIFNPGNGRNINFTNPNGGTTFVHNSDSGTAGDVITLSLDSTGHLASAIYKQLNQDKQLFDANGRMTRWQDRFGNALAFTRDASGRLTSVLDVSTNRRIDITYNTAGLIAQVADNTGRKVIYSYSTAKELLTVTNPAGKVKNYNWGSNHRITSRTDYLGNITMTTQYSSSGMVTQQTQVDGGVVGLIAHSDTIRKIIRPDGGVETYIFNAQGYLTEFDDALGHAFKTTYSPSMFTNTTTGRYIQKTDPLGRITRIDFNGNNLPVFLTDALGQKVTITYDPAHPEKMSTITDSLGHKTSFAYDAPGNLIKITDHAGNVATLTYNAKGQVLTSTNPLGQKTTYGYDALGQLSTTANPLGQMVKFAYDPLGRLTQITDAKGVATTFTYDVLDRLISVKNALGQITSYTYDANGNAISQKNPRGHTTTYGYDLKNRLTQSTDPLNHVNMAGYDQQDRFTNIWPANGQGYLQTYYDLADRPKNFNIYSNLAGMALEYDYTYDNANQLSQIFDGANNWAFTYDKLGRVTAQSGPKGTLNYTYNANSLLTQLTSPQYGTVNYGYDNLDRTITITKDAKQYAYTYDPLGKRTSLTRSNGVVTVYEYDNANRLITLTHAKGTTVLERYEYTYDANGNIAKQIRGQGTLTSITDVVVGAGSKKQVNGYSRTSGEEIERRFTYDSLNRLTNLVAIGYVPSKSTFATTAAKTAAQNALAAARAATTPAAIEQNLKTAEANGAYIPENATWTFDADGNIATKVIRKLGGALETRTFTYDAADRLIKMVKTGATTGTITYTYDADGNLISDSTGSKLTWDIQDRLFKLVSGGVTSKFTYDPLGRRASFSKGTETKQYLYNGLSLLSDGTSKFLNGTAIDETLQLDNATLSASYLQDHLGSTSRLLNSSTGAQVARYDFKSYGKLEGEVANPVSANAFTYTGREDDGTGLMYYRARYYDPELEVFISQDPFGDSQRYVKERPISNTDPLGLWLAGLTFGGSAEVGIPIDQDAPNPWSGLGATGSASVVLLGPSGTFGNTFQSYGGVVALGGEDKPISFITDSCVHTEPGVGGAYFGIGGGGFLSNANDVTDLAGAFKTISVNVGLGIGISGQYSWGYNSKGEYIGQLSVSKFGPGFGFSVSKYLTTTQVQR